MFFNIWQKCCDNISFAMKDWKYFWYISAIFCAMWAGSLYFHYLYRRIRQVIIDFQIAIDSDEVEDIFDSGRFTYTL